MTGTIIFILVFAASAIGIAGYRRWSHRRGIIDHPNERSSHETPTPRGAGIVIVVLSLAAYITGKFVFGYDLSYEFLAGAVILAAISWLDDLYSVPFFFRLPVQAAAVIIAIYGLGHFEIVDIPIVGEVDLGVFGPILTFAWAVWMLNAYNFMDGIDGIAGIQAVAAGAGWLYIGAAAGLESVYVLGGSIAFAAAGFLVHNWEPAKVFMGDVGSAFLGYAFAFMPLLAADEQRSAASFLPVAGVLLVWFFLIDTVITFLRRLVRLEKVWQPHREHIYQRLIISGARHSHISLIYGLTAAVLTVLTVFRLKFGEFFDPFIVSYIVAATIGLAAAAYFRGRD